MLFSEDDKDVLEKALNAIGYNRPYRNFSDGERMAEVGGRIKDIIVAFEDNEIFRDLVLDTSVYTCSVKSSTGLGWKYIQFLGAGYENDKHSSLNTDYFNSRETLSHSLLSLWEGHPFLTPKQFNNRRTTDPYIKYDYLFSPEEGVPTYLDTRPLGEAYRYYLERYISTSLFPRRW